MAHFYGSLRGEKGKKVTHTGSETSGLNATLNGFGFGVRVSLHFDGNEDKADIYLTGGSNDEMKPVLIGTFGRMDIIKFKQVRKIKKK